MVIKYIPHQETYVGSKYKETYYKHCYTHLPRICLIAIANNKIVPGQWAEYCASAVLPVSPNPIE
jgi:hypothetical protein